MERTTSIVEVFTGNVTMFPSNYDAAQLFFAVNDELTKDDDEFGVVTASVLMNREQLVELIATLAMQLAYISEQEGVRA